MSMTATDLEFSFKGIIKISHSVIEFIDDHPRNTDEIERLLIWLVDWCNSVVAELDGECGRINPSLLADVRQTVEQVIEPTIGTLNYEFLELELRHNLIPNLLEIKSQI